MKQFSLKVARREGIGRGASRRARQTGRIPAIIYGKLNAPQTLSLDGPEFTRLLKGIAGSAAIIEIKETDADQRLSIIQEIQRDPMSDRILHVDLHEVSASEEMEIEVTVHPVGDCVGVRTENGILETVSHQVRVRCLPKNLPAFVEVDVSNLHINHSLHLRELPAVPGVKYIGNPDQPIFACVEPVVEVEPTPAAEAVAVEGAVPAEGAEGAAAAPAAGDAKAGAAKAGAAAPAAGAEAKGAAPAKPGAAPAKGAEAKAPAGDKKPAAKKPEKK